MGAVPLIRPCSALGRSTAVAKMHPANESTPLDAEFLARQVASVEISRCAVAKGPETRNAIPAVSKQRFKRTKHGKPHPQSAPGQQRHPARRRVARLPSRFRGTVSLCGRKGSCTTISDRMGVSKRRCPRSTSGNPSPECTGQRKHPAQRRFPGPPSRFSGNTSLCGRKGSCTTISAGVYVAKHRCSPPRSGTHHDCRGTTMLGSESRFSSGGNGTGVHSSIPGRALVP